MNTLKIVTASLGIIASTALLWHTQAQAEAIDQFQPLFFQQAEKALTQQQPEEALALLEGRVEKLARKSFRAAGSELLCRAHFQLADYATAEASCDQAVRLGGEGDSGWSYFNNRGVMRLVQGNIAGAMSDFEQALRLKPRSEAVQTNAAVARRELARMEDTSRHNSIALSQ